MTGHNDTERILDAFLAPEHDQLPDRVVDAALTEIARTPQRRALRVPWRFPLMPQLLRYAVVAVVLVAVAGVGGALLFTRSGNAGPGAVAPEPTPTPTPAPTAAPTATPAPSEIAPGITGWTPYTSEVDGLTFSVPDGWTLFAAATRKWRAGDGVLDGVPPYSDTFGNPPDRDGDDIGLFVYQRPAGSGADITSREGLAAWVEANECNDQLEACETVPDLAVPMCVGKTACLPAILVPFAEGTLAVFADAETGLVTVVSLGRPDGFPAAARYGGAVQLLKSILTTMDVWTPEPGQIPSSG